jgi:hypothetical protein
MVADIGVLARPLRVEAVLLTMLVFLGSSVASVGRSGPAG